jgi:hypothetical protein
MILDFLIVRVHRNLLLGTVRETLKGESIGGHRVGNQLELC